jgi:hypothetical protein
MSFKYGYRQKKNEKETCVIAFLLPLSGDDYKID